MGVYLNSSQILNGDRFNGHYFIRQVMQGSVMIGAVTLLLLFKSGFIGRVESFPPSLSFLPSVAY